MIDLLDIDKTDEYELKFLDESYLEQILYLQHLVTENLSDPSSYYVDLVEEEFFNKHLASRNSTIGIFYENQLVGFHIVSYPGLYGDDLGVDIGLKEEELSQVAQFGAVAVHPDHRNKGLLTRASKEHLKMLKVMGYRHICLRIAPHNYPSIKASIMNGFVIKGLKFKYNNLLRYIFHLDINKHFKQPLYSVRINNADIESQKFIIGLGFYGYDVLKYDIGFDIVFGHDGIKV